MRGWFPFYPSQKPGVQIPKPPIQTTNLGLPAHSFRAPLENGSYQSLPRATPQQDEACTWALEKQKVLAGKRVQQIGNTPNQTRVSNKPNNSTSRPQMSGRSPPSLGPNSGQTGFPTPDALRLERLAPELLDPLLRSGEMSRGGSTRFSRPPTFLGGFMTSGWGFFLSWSIISLCFEHPSPFREETRSPLKLRTPKDLKVNIP